MLSLFVAPRKAALRCQARQLCKALAAAALGLALCAEVASAGGPTPPADNAAGSPPYGTTTWGGLGWGIGIATDFNVGGKRVTDAEIVGPAPGLVRVKDTSNDVAVGFVLEAHYFFRDWAIPVAPGGCSAAADKATSGSVAPRGVKFTLPCTDAAVGPFVAIEVANGNSSSPAAGGLITAFAVGGMVGFRHGSVDQSGTFIPDSKNPNASWNFGVGLRINPHSQVLGDGFTPNMPPPVGETAVRWKYEPRYGVMLLSSFSF